VVGELGIFLNLKASLAREISEFFQVPEPIIYRRRDRNEGSMKKYEEIMKDI